MSPVTSPAAEVAIDNDVVLKAVGYGLVSVFWQEPYTSLGVIGAAPFVISKAIDRGARVHNRQLAAERLRDFIKQVTVLEPSDEELDLAAELELAAQRRGLPVDSGESQLAAIVIERMLRELITGDKRAIASLETLAEDVEQIAGLERKLRCLEQVVLRFIDEHFEDLSAAICTEPDLDKTLSICFGCRSAPRAVRSVVVEGLESYIRALRSEAPMLLSD
jgi:predicted nucleic acid-binding protein